MPYATLDDLIERAGQREILDTADRDKDGVADADVIASALATAEAEINGYAATKYTLPFVEVPALVRNWTVSLARYYLHRSKRPELVKEDYDNAISQLQDVAAGKITLPQASGETPSLASGTYLISAPPPRFSRRALQGFNEC
ncbi:gp436 family protein [Rhizobium sp. 11_C7_N12_5]|uniref:gp436 family protein n=1 Tax=Rhizobium sp. 11_C7_N12_5 TaxID=3240770 RepID=UPI003F224F33